ncbi:uncharacterized protein LOC144016658 [Festucalex cinctus]
MYCSQAKEKLYEWPKDNRARKWTTFVRAKRMNFTPSSKSVLCYKHFEDACFLNQSAYDKGFAKKLLLNATAVPTIHLPPQDQQQIQNPPAQRAAAANRERKRAVAEAITSAAASEQEMADYEGQLLQDKSCSNSEDDEVMPPHNVDKMMQTLKYCPPCEKCKKRANYRSIGIQCNLGQTEPKRKKACTEVNVAVVELLTKTMFVNDVMKMSHLGQTSGVEAFHSVVNHFAPKMYNFSYKGMKSRIILAAMHYNENAGRPQKVTKEGIHSYCIVYPKYKSGGYSLRKILVDATYDYVNDCLSEVMKLIDIPNKYRTGDVVVDPQFLTTAVNRPEKSNVIAEHHTRFLRK